jgi:hypothetical protein
MRDKQFRIQTEITNVARGYDGDKERHPENDSSRSAVSQGSETMKATDMVSIGYRETFDERGWKGSIYGATINNRSICATTIALPFVPYSKATSPSVGP